MKATFKLPDGTEVTVDGNSEEVQFLLGRYGKTTEGGEKTKGATGKKRASPKSDRDAAKPDQFSHTEIANFARNCDEAEEIEAQILDRLSQVNRVLLPLYIVHEYLENRHGLTSGDIAEVTRELGVPISQSNASSTLSGTAAKYVIAEGARKKGKKRTYKLSRRGVTYLKAVIAGKSNEK